MIPMNLRRPGKSADYVDTGSWASKAIKEAKITGATNVAWSGKGDNYTRIPKKGDLKLSPDAEYLHICTNETIGGIRWMQFPETSAPLVADMSSEILSRTVDVKRFAMIYAGAQKNLGPSGLAIVIIRKDLAERAPESVPIFLRYSTHIADGSMYNTPNTWGIYMLKLTCDWVESQGGVAGNPEDEREKGRQALRRPRFKRFLALAGGKREPLHHEYRLAPPERSFGGAVSFAGKESGLRRIKGAQVRGRHSRERL